MTDLDELSGFQRGRQSALDTAVAKQTATPNTVIQPEKETPLGDVLRNAFEATTLTAAGARLLDQPTFVPEDNFDPLAFAKSDSNVLERLDQFLVRDEFEDLFGELRDARSGDEFRYIVDQAEESMARMQMMADNPKMSIAAGLGAGIGEGIILGGVVGGAAKAAQVARIAKGLSALTATKSRAAASAAVAAGTTEAGIVGLQDLTDPLITLDDYALAAGAGAAIGGAGGAIAKAFSQRGAIQIEPDVDGEVVVGSAASRPQPIEAEEVTISRPLAAERDDATSGDTISASLASVRSDAASGKNAATPDTSPVTEGDYVFPAEGAGNVVANRLGAGKVQQQYLRTPVPLSKDVGVRGRKDYEQGYIGNAEGFQALDKLLRVTTIREGNVDGSSARRLAVRDHLDILDNKYAATGPKADEIWKATRKDLGLSVLERTNLPTGQPVLTQRQFMALADELAIGRGSGRTSFEYGTIFGDEFAHLTPDQRAALQPHLSKQADLLDDFYEDLARQEAALGLLDGDAVRRGYRPQVWNKQAIMANRTEFEQMIARSFRGNHPSTTAGEALSQARKTADAILKTDDISGMAWKELAEIDPARFKSREIHLGLMRHTDAARKFLNRDTEIMTRGYIHNVGPAIGLNRAFGTSNPATIVNKVGRAFDLDVKKAKAEGKTKLVKRLQKDKDQVTQLITNVIDEATGDVIRSTSADARSAASIATSASTIGLLGQSLLSSLGDTASVAFKASKPIQAIGNLLRVQGQGMVRELRKLGQDDLAMLVEGAGFNDGARLLRGFELDDGLNASPGRLQAAARLAQGGATLSMKFSTFLHQWTAHMRVTYGALTAKNILDDTASFGKLSPSLKSWYARHGIDRDMAKRVKDLLKADHVVVGKRKLPDLKAWSSKDPEVAEAFQQAMISAADEAMPSVGLGDRPFWANKPAGKLVNQFTTFAHAAGSKQIGPAIEAARVHRDARSVGIASAYLASLFTFGFVSHAARQVINGRDDELARELQEQPEQVLLKSLLRSSLAMGKSANISEFLGTQFGGRTINDVLDKSIGLRLLPETQQRFQDRNPAVAFLGPAFGVVNIGINIGGSLADGDIDKAVDRLLKVTPLANNPVGRALKTASE